MTATVDWHSTANDHWFVLFSLFQLADYAIKVRNTHLGLWRAYYCGLPAVHKATIVPLGLQTFTNSLKMLDLSIPNSESSCYCLLYWRNRLRKATSFSHPIYRLLKLTRFDSDSQWALSAATALWEIWEVYLLEIEKIQVNGFVYPISSSMLIVSPKRSPFSKIGNSVL